MPHPLQSRYLHLVPIEPGECLPSWLLRIANRETTSFQSFSSKWFADDLRVTPGFDAFPASALLVRLGAIRLDELDHYITRHTLLGTTKCFYTEAEWHALIAINRRGGVVSWDAPLTIAGHIDPEFLPQLTALGRTISR